MRLRNLFEVQVQPGERKGFSLRLKRLEDIQLKVAQIQNTISQLGGVDVPDVLKKQMDDLINSAKIEKEKVYAEISDAEVKNPRIQGIPGSVVKLLKGIEKNASTIMNAYRRTGKYLYRGIKSSDDALYGKPFDSRRAKDSNADLSNALNQALADQGFTARRDNTTFTSGAYSQASNYGTVYIIFPRDGFSFHYSKKIRDLVLGTDKMDMLVDPEITNYIESAIRSNWENLKKYFPYKFSGDNFFTGYEYQRDLDGVQQAVAAGDLPPEFGKYKSFNDLVNPEKVIANFQYDQTDLDSAINSGHEVMITGPYYAIKNESFKEYVDKYISMTANGEFDITPDTNKEKSTLDQKIKSIVGSNGPEFSIGDWVQHKYEGFKGKVVDYYHTNDFVQIEDYAGKLRVVNKKNLDKIKTPEMPDYQPGDKVYLRTKDTEWEYYNNKKYKVVSSDNYTVTVKKGSYDDTITIPKLLTEPAPKYDTADPQVGDTVHVIKGDFNNLYGTITYVSSYSKDIDVDFGDGDSHSVKKGSYEVIDPATKPESASTPVPFKQGDYIKIADDGSDFSSVVAEVITPGIVKSRVKPFNDNSYSTTIKNSRLQKIDKEEYEKQSFKHNDTVEIIGGKHDGKIGKFTYASWDGTLEITDSNGKYFESPAKYVFKLTDSTKLKNPEIDIKKGDFVQISKDSELFPGSVAKVVVKNSSEKSTILVHDNKDLDYIIDTKYLSKIDEKEFNNKKLSKGEEVKITDGYYKGKTGEILSFSATGSVKVNIINKFSGENFAILSPPENLEKINKNNNISDDDLIDLDDLEFEPLDEPTPPKKTTEPAQQDIKKKFKDLVELSKEKGYLTYDDLLKFLPAELSSTEQVEDIMSMLSEMGIKVVDTASDDTPQELQARINDPEVKQNLKIALQNSEVKELVKTAIENKSINDEFVYKVSELVGFDKYLFAIKPYLELKGVQIGN